MIRSHNLDWGYLVKSDPETSSFNISKHRPGEIIAIDPASATGDITITLDSAFARSRKPGPLTFLIVSATTTNNIIIAHNSLCYTFAADLTLGSPTEDLTGVFFELVSDGTKWTYGDSSVGGGLTPPVPVTITGSKNISALDPGVIYAVNNAADVTLVLDAKVAGEWDFVILKTTAAGSEFIITDGANFGLASPGTTYTFGGTDIEEKGLCVKVIGTGVGASDGFAISHSPEPEDIIGEVQTASVNISTLKSGYVYPIAHTAACTLTIGTIATQGVWRFEIKNSTDTAGAGFKVIIDGTHLPSGTNIEFGGAEDEQQGRIFRIVSDGVNAYVDFTVKTVIGATLTTDTNISALEPGVIYPLDAATAAPGATQSIILNGITGAPGTYYFMPIVTTDHATDFFDIVVGALCYNSAVDIDLGGAGVELNGKLQRLVFDGTKFGYNCEHAKFWHDDATGATHLSDVTATGVIEAGVGLIAPTALLQSAAYTPTADDINGAQASRIVKLTYDVDINGKTIGTHTIGLDMDGTGAQAHPIPAGSLIKKTWLWIETAFTSGAAATVAFQIAGANDVITATAFNDALYTVNTAAEGIQDGAPANMSVLAGTPSIVIGTADLIAGRVHLYVEYVTAL